MAQKGGCIVLALRETAVRGMSKDDGVREVAEGEREREKIYIFTLVLLSFVGLFFF